MVRKINVDILKAVGNYLPVHKRKPLRLNLLRTMMSVFYTMRTEYMLWRDEAITKAYVTGETMSIEWYLNYLCSSGSGIYIETAGASGVAAGIILTETSIYVVGGIISSEPTKYVSAGLYGENSIWGTKSFIVYIPTAASGYNDLITSVVNVYRSAGHTFKIVLY